MRRKRNMADGEKETQFQFLCVIEYPNGVFALPVFFILHGVKTPSFSRSFSTSSSSSRFTHQTVWESQSSSSSIFFSSLVAFSSSFLLASFVRDLQKVFLVTSFGGLETFPHKSPVLGSCSLFLRVRRNPTGSEEEISPALPRERISRRDAWEFLSHSLSVWVSFHPALEGEAILPDCLAILSEKKVFSDIVAYPPHLLLRVMWSGVSIVPLLSMLSTLRDKIKSCYYVVCLYSSPPPSYSSHSLKETFLPSSFSSCSASYQPAPTFVNLTSDNTSPSSPSRLTDDEKSSSSPFAITTGEFLRIASDVVKLMQFPLTLVFFLTLVVCLGVSSGYHGSKSPSSDHRTSSLTADLDSTLDFDDDELDLTCPFECDCKFQQQSQLTVDCSNRGLTYVPKNIPSNARRLWVFKESSVNCWTLLAHFTLSCYGWRG